MLLAVKEWIFP